MRKLLILAALVCPLVLAQTIITSTSTPGTYNWSSTGTWVGGVVPGTGTRAVCSSSGVVIVVDVNTTVGDSPTASTPVVTQSGGCLIGINQSVTWTLLGGYNKGGTFRRAASSKIVFDSTGAASPTSTPYTLNDNGVWTDDATHPPTNTIVSSVDQRFTITANNATGTNWRWANTTVGSGITGMVNGFVQYCGDPAGAAFCLPYLPGGSGSFQIGMTGPAPTPPTGTAPVTAPVCTNCAPVTFDHTCGIKYGTGSSGGGGTTSNDAINLNITFKNTYSACDPMYLATGNSPNPGVARTMTNMVWDVAPDLQMSAGTIYNSVIFNCPTAGINTGALGQMSYVWVRCANEAGFEGGDWNWLNSTITGDSLLTYAAGVPVNPVPSYSGTITSATSTSFTDSTFTFPTNVPPTTPNVIDDTETANGGWTTSITSGANAGGAQPNVSVTGSAHTINVQLPWQHTPSAGDHYALYPAMANWHATDISAGTTWNGTIFWFQGGDPNGDCYHSANAVAVYNFENTIIPPSMSRNNMCTFGTLGGATGTPGTQYFIHNNTYFAGFQGTSACEFCPTNNTGVIKEFMDNLAIQDPAVNYKSGLGYMIYDTGAPTSSFIDQIAQNCGVSGTGPCGDFNGVFGMPGSNSMATAGLCSTVHGGSIEYNLMCSQAYGVHDLIGDPGLLCEYCDVITWTQSLGVDTTQGDHFQILGDTMTNLMCINDPTPNSCTPGFTPVAFWNYMQHSYTRTNAIYHTTGSGIAGPDGSDIGAAPYMAPTATPNFSTSGAVKFSGSSVIQ